MTTLKLIGCLMVVIPLGVGFTYCIFDIVKQMYKRDPKFARFVVLSAIYLGIALFLMLGCDGNTTATPLTDLNETLKQLDKEIEIVLPSVEEVVKGCEVRPNKGIGPERDLVLCRI